MPGGVPHIEFQFANADTISVTDAVFDFHRWHIEQDSLGSNFGVSRQFFASFEITGRGRVARDTCFEDLFGLGESLNVINIRVRGDQCDTFRKREIELADQFNTFINRIFVANVDQRPLARVAVNQVNAAADPPPGLMVKFNNVRKNRSPFEHGIRFRA